MNQTKECFIASRACLFSSLLYVHFVSLFRISQVLFDKMNISTIIRYYKDCYQSDNRDSNPANFFSKKIEGRHFVRDSEELINQLAPYIPISEDYALETKKKLALYRKESDLYYCSFFLIGKLERTGFRNASVCAPLLLYPAEIIENNEHYFVQISRESVRINYSALNNIKKRDGNPTELFEKIYQTIARFEHHLFDVSEISMVLEKYFPDLDTSELVQFPKLYSAAKIKADMKKISVADNFKLLPAAAVAMIWKSNDTLGVVNELEQIASENEFSAPVEAIFAGKNVSENQEVRTERVPVILNNAQKKIIASASTNAISLLVGPPGTGKSYTIASLAIEHLSKGKSVLIAARTDEAVDVIAEKIENQIGIDNVLVRGGRKKYLRALKHYLKNLLSGINVAEESKDKSPSKLKRKIKNLDNFIHNCEKKFNKRVDDERKWGQYIAENENNQKAFAKLVIKYINWLNSYKNSHWSLIQELDKSLQEINDLIVEYIKLSYNTQVEKTLRKNRNELNLFLRAISSRTGAMQENYFEQIDFNIILKTFPIWLVKLNDIYKVIPLRTELFDLAIIDEATQCDTAICIPIMQRAKKIVFAGDPNQLRHVSFLSFDRQNFLKKKYSLVETGKDRLNYREKSILDVVDESIENQEQVVFLNEHYRSKPAIISFSNTFFYNNALHLMTQKPDTLPDDGIVLIKCNGKRDKNGVNHQEAEIIIKKIHEIVCTQKELSPKACQSIGVLSPFRDQVDYLMKKIAEQFDVSAIEKHEIIVGTAYTFQGNERDIVFLSFAVDKNTHHSAFLHLNKRDVFNVSITRARSLQYVIYSVNVADLGNTSLFRKYIESLQNGASPRADKQCAKEKDIFITEFKAEIDKLGSIAAWIAYPVAGISIDIILQYDNQTIGVDLIGYPGDFYEAFTIERYKVLNRTGLRVFPLPFTYWRLNKEMCMNELKQFLNYKRN